jgi:hypothetical protein
VHHRHEVSYDVGDVVQARSKEGRYSEAPQLALLAAPRSTLTTASGAGHDCARPRGRDLPPRMERRRDPNQAPPPCAAAPPSRPSGSLDCSVSRIDSEHLRNSAGELYGLGRRMRYGVPPPEVLSGILLRSALPENDLNLARMVISDGDCLPLCHVPGWPCSLSLSLWYDELSNPTCDSGMSCILCGEFLHN